MLNGMVASWPAHGVGFDQSHQNPIGEPTPWPPLSVAEMAWMPVLSSADRVRLSSSFIQRPLRMLPSKRPIQGSTVSISVTWLQRVPICGVKLPPVQLPAWQTVCWAMKSAQEGICRSA